MTQVAVPVSSVVAVQVSDPLSVNVTGSPEIGVSVSVLVRTAETGVGEEKSPVHRLHRQRGRRCRMTVGGVCRHELAVTLRP